MTRNRVPSVVALLRAVAPDADRAAVVLDLMVPMALADKSSAESCTVARATQTDTDYPRVIRQKVT